MNSRIVEIDIYKGIAIMLVVLGHLEIPELLRNFIFMFHVPAFFFIAGVTYKYNEKNTVWQELKKNAFRLLIPYLFFSVIVDVTILASQYISESGIIWQERFSLRNILINVLDTIVGGGLEGVTMTHGVTWFLYAMFMSRMLLFLINKLTVNKLLSGGGVFYSFSYYQHTLMPLMECYSR